MHCFHEYAVMRLNHYATVLVHIHGYVWIGPQVKFVVSWLLPTDL